MAQEYIAVKSTENLGNIEIHQTVFESIVKIVLEDFKNDAIIVDSGFKSGASFSISKTGLSKVSVDIKVMYGKNAERVSRQIQQKIHQMILKMCDVSCDQIDVNVLGFQFNKA